MASDVGLHLPTEVLIIIIGFLFEDWSTNLGTSQASLQQRDIYNFCRVSRHWYSVGISHLYDSPYIYLNGQFDELVQTICQDDMGIVSVFGSMMKQVDLGVMDLQGYDNQLADLLQRLPTLEFFTAPQISLKKVPLPFPRLLRRRWVFGRQTSLRDFFTRHSRLQWRFAVYIRDVFLHIEIPMLRAHWTSLGSQNQTPVYITQFAGYLARAQAGRAILSVASTQYKGVSGQGRNSRTTSGSGSDGASGASSGSTTGTNLLGTMWSSMFWVLACPACPREFITLEKFRSHCPVVHNSDLTPEQTSMCAESGQKTSFLKVFTCTECQRTFTHPATYTTYWKSNHTGDVKPATLSLIDRDDYNLLGVGSLGCDSDYANFQRWYGHNHFIHKSSLRRYDDTLEYKPDFKFECPAPKCGWTFKRRGAYLYHISKFHPGVELGDPDDKQLYKQFAPSTPNNAADQLHPTGPAWVPCFQPFFQPFFQPSFQSRFH